jgi:hypothetical protein
MFGLSWDHLHVIGRTSNDSSSETIAKGTPMERKRSTARLRGGIMLAALSLVGLTTLSGVGSAQTQVAPTNTVEPQISGKPVVDGTLTATRGQWTGSPTSYGFQWARCPSSGSAGDASDCAALGGATTRAYVPGKGDVGHRLRVLVTATNADGAKTVASNATGVVKDSTTTTPPPPPPVSNGCAKNGGTVPASGITPPARLNIDQSQVSPSTVTYGTRSITTRFHVSACGGSVEGALVYVTAVPYGMFANANEQTTGPDGWATLQFNALAGFPVSTKQQVLVMFVRARKSGEDLLGGISTRRLISFQVNRG